MDLTTLGASGSYPSATSACSGYLLRHDGFTVWMDAGNGTLVELQKHVALGDVDAVVLSHTHPDHCADLYPFFFWLLFAERSRPVPIVTPPGVRERLEQLIGADSRARFRALLDWREQRPGDQIELGPFRIQMFDAAHSVANNTMRIRCDAAVLCYSGDTGPNEHLAEAAHDADLFLCEASWNESQRGLMEPVHLTASDAGRAAKDAGTKRLVLTHIWPDNDRGGMLDEAASTFDGRIDLAEQLGTVQL